MGRNKQVRVAVIGCGVISELHLHCFSNNPFCKVVATCDLVPDRAKAAAEKSASGVWWTTDAADIFASSQVDAVSVCTDHASHAALACAALESGKHVLCEKSLARTASDMRKMLDCAHRHPKLVASGVFQHRFEPLPRVLKALVAEGAFGKLLTASGSLCCFRGNDYFLKDAWRGTKAGEGGSVLINQAIHYFDLLLWIAGGGAAAKAFSANLGHSGIIETEDTISIALRMKNGALGAFTATSASDSRWESNLFFNGTAGSVVVKNDALESLSFSDLTKKDEVRSIIDDALKAASGTFAKGKDYYGTGHQAQIDDFIDAIRLGRPPFVSFSDAAESDALVFSAYASAARR